jgi:serine/threonine-protein kinase RsbW
MPQDLVLDLPNDLASIEEAVEFVMDRCSSCSEEPRKLRLNLRVGLSEALANAMLYGNGRDPAKRVKVEVAFLNTAITARVTDEGRGFNPCHLPDPTCAGNLLKSQGRGIFLMRKLLDEVHFNDRGNSVTLVLRLPPYQADVEVDGGAVA